MPPIPSRSYLTNDIRFAIPADWTDRSIVMLTPPAPPTDGEESVAPAGTPFAVTIHRDVPQPDEDLAGYLARQIDALRQAIPDLEVLRQGARTIGGEPARDVEFAWTADQGRMRQHQVHVLRGGAVLTWTATASAASYLNHVGAYADVLASVKFITASVTIAPAPRGPSPEA